MKLKIDRFKDLQNKMKNVGGFYSDITELPNTFLRVLKLLEESDTPRLGGMFGGGGTIGGTINWTGTDDLTINTTSSAWPLTLTDTQLNLTSDAGSAVTLT